MGISSTRVVSNIEAVEELIKQLKVGCCRTPAAVLQVESFGNCIAQYLLNSFHLF